MTWLTRTTSAVHEAPWTTHLPVTSFINRCTPEVMIREFRTPIATALPRMSKELSKRLNSTFLLKVTWEQAFARATYLRHERQAKVSQRLGRCFSVWITALEIFQASNLKAHTEIDDAVVSPHALQHLVGNSYAAAD